MGFDDHFENRASHGRHNYNYRDDNDYPHNRYKGKFPGREHYAIYIIDKVWNNRKLRFLFILSILILLMIITAALFLLIPLLSGIIDSVTQNGLKSVAEDVAGFITRIWTGSGN